MSKAAKKRKLIKLKIKWILVDLNHNDNRLHPIMYYSQKWIKYFSQAIKSHIKP